MPVEQAAALAPEGNAHKLKLSRKTSRSLILLTLNESDTTLNLRAVD